VFKLKERTANQTLGGSGNFQKIQLKMNGVGEYEEEMQFCLGCVEDSL
jgi:hypothetical protein